MSYEWTESTRPSRRHLAEQPAQFSREEVKRAMRRAVDALSAQQTPEGFWCGELTADTTLESDYILLQLWLNQPENAAGIRRRAGASTGRRAPFWIARWRTAVSTSTRAAPPT